MQTFILAPLKRKILVLSCLALLVQSLVAIPNGDYRSHSDLRRKAHHSRVGRTLHIRDTGRNEDGSRKTKFSYLGPAGIRSHDQATAKMHGVYIGVIPDAGDTGGKAQTMAEIIKSLKGKRPAVFGWYAQVSPDYTFDGNQLFEVMRDLKDSKAVFSPAIMPQKSWAGFTWKDNHQAVAIARVLRKFTDEGIPVVLRFAHEVNWYQRTMEYPGHASDFKEAWAVLAAAMRKIAPDVLLHWCPNVSTMKEYHKYAPDDMDATVDLVGIDFYPKQKPKEGEFLAKVKEFYDTFAVNGRLFAMGEAGLHYAGSYADRINWLNQMTQAKKDMPNFIYVNWYNSQKEFDYKIAGNGVSTTLLTEKLE